MRRPAPAKLAETHLTELGGRLPEQPAELRDRDPFAA